MLRTIITYGGAICSLIYYLPKMRRMKKLRAELPREEFTALAEKWTGDWAAGRVRQAKARVSVVGEQNIPEGAVLFVSNHQSNFDIPVFMSCIRKPKGFVAKIETKKIPMIRKWMEHIDCVFIDRDDIRQTAKVMLDGIALLKGGHSMVLFPEGTRNKGGETAEFKAGSFKLATKAGVPIVPVTLDGTYKIIEANGGWRIKPADIVMTIHPAIETAGTSREEQAELVQKVRDIIVSGLHNRSFSN